MHVFCEGIEMISRRFSKLTIQALLWVSIVMACTSAVAQSKSELGTGILGRYSERMVKTLAHQPRWMSPLITTGPRLEQQERADFARQRNRAGYDTWNLGYGKGLETVPYLPIQLSVNWPPFIDHTQPNRKDGFGDINFRLKYRAFAQNEQHGDYVFSMLLTGSVPTGKNGNGSCCAIVTPAVAGEKGWGKVNLVMSASGSLPVTGEANLGHTVSWNTTMELRPRNTGFAHYLWPELESNTNFFLGGSNDSNAESFVTPALLVGRLPLHHTGKGGLPSRNTLTFGGGIQIAVTEYHTYNHSVVLTMRVPF